MSSVTNRIKQIKQPYGGYLPIKSFNKEILNDGAYLYENENIHASLVGISVDYLTRYLMGASVDEAFHISTLGAKVINKEDVAIQLKQKICGLEDESVIAACKLAGFDVCYRSSPLGYKPVEEINPDCYTIENIKTMVKRSVALLKKRGPIICSEPSFEGGYTEVVTAGDGDYVTTEALWDFKVSKSSPNSAHTLQLLMYYLMGLHSIHNYYNQLKYLCIFNPRTNTVYSCDISHIEKYVFSEVELNVIGYSESLFANCANPVSNANKPKASEIIETRTITRTIKIDGMYPHEYTERTVTKTTMLNGKKHVESSRELELGNSKTESNFNVTDRTNKNHERSEYSIEEVANITGKSRNEIYAEIENGNLMTKKRDGKRYVPKEYLEEYQEKLEKKDKAILYIALGIICIVVITLMLSLGR